jgi:hypothetical protein
MFEWVLVDVKGVCRFFWRGGGVLGVLMNWQCQFYIKNKFE